MSISGARRAGALAIALACAGLLVLSACGSGGRTVGAVPGSAPASGIEPPAAPTGTVTPDSGSSVGEPAPAAPAKPSRVLPNLVGKGLQVAQDRTHAAGFDAMTSHDASGRKRVQIFDRDWKVCFQFPSAGSHAASTKVDFGTVKLQERCPAKDKGNAQAKQIMPDLRGKSAAAAFAFLGLDASISWRDGTGADRSILLPTNWKVCVQTPKPGAKYNGVPVTLTVVKISEKC